MTIKQLMSGIANRRRFLKSVIIATGAVWALVASAVFIYALCTDWENISASEYLPLFFVIFMLWGPMLVIAGFPISVPVILLLGWLISSVPQTKQKVEPPTEQKMNPTDFGKNRKWWEPYSLSFFGALFLLSFVGQLILLWGQKGIHSDFLVWIAGYLFTGSPITLVLWVFASLTIVGWRERAGLFRRKAKPRS